MVPPKQPVDPSIRVVIGRSLDSRNRFNGARNMEVDDIIMVVQSNIKCLYVGFKCTIHVVFEFEQ